jgi:hypothetical protein
MSHANRKRGSGTPTPTAPPNASLSFAAIQDPELNARDCKILWALAYWAWGSKPNCWPSNEAIGNLIGYKARAVQVGLKQLEARGHIYRRMVKTDRGWHRLLTIAERYRPALTIVEGGSADPCATPGADPCATPAHRPAPPLAQIRAPQTFEDPEEEKKKLAESSRPKEGPRLGQAKEEGEPAWLKVDHLSAAEADEWRMRAQDPGPFGRIARKIVERLDRGSASAPGSLPRSPRADAEGNASRSVNSIKNRESGQDKSGEIEHKTH